MTTPKLKEGYWYNENAGGFIQVCKGNKMSCMNMIALDFPDLAKPISEMGWTFGEFGPATKEVKEASGCDTNNLQFTPAAPNVPPETGVVNKTGTKIFMAGLDNPLDVLYWVSDEEAQKMKDDRDPMEAPSCPQYIPKPGSPGKLYWLTGPPSSGKSTTCQLLARNKDFVYFEGDAAIGLINPFTDINAENLTSAIFTGKSLKGYSREDAKVVFDLSSKFQELFSSTMDAQIVDTTLRPSLTIMAKDILRQKKRLGGNFAISYEVISRESRDLLRAKLGSELVFIVLNLTKECQNKKIKDKVPGEEKFMVDNLNKIYDAHQPAEDDEQNAYNITIDETKTPAEVMQSVLDVISNHEKRTR